MWHIYSSILDNPLLAVLVILALFGFISLGAYLLRKFIPSLRGKEIKIDEEEAAREEIERVIVKVEDDATKEQMEQFGPDATKPKD
ncbi:MAG TPA: hypothetical protein DCM23_00785 [Firmicutes bacterium]|jgi:hypothetical protein|nr:hypothetical protein [Bacillota bacterium]